MPLKTGSSEKVVGENIAELRAAGHPENQAIAIAEKEAGKSTAKDSAPCAGIMFIAGDRVLLMLRAAEADNGATWAFPAGHVESGETDLQAAVREAAEETGYAPDPATVTAVSKVNDFALFVCRCEQFGPRLTAEHDGFVWARRVMLPTPLHPGVAEAIADCGMDSGRAPAATGGGRQLSLLPTFDPIAFHRDWVQDESARQLDVNGWPEVRDNPLSKVGVFTYGPGRIRTAPDQTRSYEIYRPAEELGADECVDSFKLLPWINDHVMLGPEETGRMPTERKGIDGVIGQDVYFDEADGVLRGNIKIFSDRLRGLIDSGKKQLSAGYTCVYDWTAGVFNGKRYDAVQRRIRGNHLALVHQGRMGPDVAVLDSAGTLDFSVFAFDAKDATMAEADKDKPKDDGKGDTDKPKGDADKPAAAATAEKPKMSLEDFAGAFGEHMPVLMEHAMTMAKKGAELAGGGATPTADTDTDKPGGDKQTPKADPADPDKDKDKKGEAMDSVSNFKSMAAQFAARDALARQVSQHVGTFDAAEMTLDEVARYGCDKLAIKAPAGQEQAMLAGFLMAKGDPSKRPVAKPSTAMDSANGGSFVSKWLAA